MSMRGTQPSVRASAPEATWRWLAALAPGINLIILRLFCAAFMDKGTTR